MTVVYRGSSTPNSTASAATVTLTQDIPSLADGDYMLMALYCNSTVNGPPQPPPGWTLLESTDGASFFGEVWGRIAASEPGSYTIDRNGVTAKIYGGFILAFHSDSAQTLYVDASDTKVNASSTNRTCPGVTTTKASAGLACFFSLGSNANSTPPGDMTERLDSLFNSGLRAYAMTSILTVAGPTGDKVATGTAGTSRAITVAIAETLVPGGLSVTLEDLTLVATGHLTNIGSLNVTLEDLTLVGAGFTENRGGLNITLDDVIVEGSGQLGSLALSPTHFFVTALNTKSILLRWKELSIPTTPLQGIKIERFSGVDSFAEIADVAPGIMEYRDSGLDPDTLYTYQIRSYTA